MQTVLGNPMASPATLGVSNAAVFGANLSIIALSGGFLSTGNNLTSYTAGADPFATSALAFVFAAGSVLVVLALCRLRDFSPNVVVLAGIALGSVWTAATTILQFYATDVGLSAAVIWSFGDLGRATYRADWIMLAVTAAGIAVFAALAWRYNALLSGGDAAGSMGVNVALLRWVSLLLASLITAVCVSFLGMIGFVGIICPHAVKRLVGHDHRWALPAATLCGGALLLAAVLALGLLALTVRALLGRRRLRQAAARYQDPDCRMGCGYILCAVHDLLGQPGLPEDPLSPEDAEDLVYLEREVWYSGHTMTEDQRRRCLALLESARRVWREQTPALRRFAARFITCKVF